MNPTSCDLYDAPTLTNGGGPYSFLDSDIDGATLAVARHTHTDDARQQWLIPPHTNITPETSCPGFMSRLRDTFDPFLLIFIGVCVACWFLLPSVGSAVRQVGLGTGAAIHSVELREWRREKCGI